MRNVKIVLSAALAAVSFVAAADDTAKVVSFKDASKIKSWDAWDDHLKKKGWKEKPCVTWKALNELDPAVVRHEEGKTVLTDVPVWDSPVMIAEHVSVPRRHD